MDALKPTPLEGFIWTEALESLRQTLWPRDGGSGGEEDDCSVRYIELSQHPSLGVLAAQADLVHCPNMATFIVRNEYLIFMRHALSRLEEKSHWGCFFVAGQSSPTPTWEHPLYLQPPQYPSFAPVDAILVTRSVLGFTQSSPPESHSGAFVRMLGIMSKLTGMGYIEQVLYCLVGTDVERVQSHVKETRRMLAKLQKLNTDQLCDELGLPIEVACKRLLAKFRVVGYTFHSEDGLQEFE